MYINNLIEIPQYDRFLPLVIWQAGSVSGQDEANFVF